MAAVPALQGRPDTAPPGFTSRVPPSPARRGSAAGPQAAEAELEHLRHLAAGIIAWRCGRLTAHARRRLAAAPPVVPVGAFAECFAAWLDAHPERANEPLAWLARDALQDLYG